MKNFNQAIPRKMHIDINSCFATIEQQANPLLRDRPIAVAARNYSYGTIVASSYEAKKLGIKVGTKVNEAKKLCPKIVIVEPDPAKYRDVHIKIKALLGRYTDKVIPKSIDEFVLDFSHKSFDKLDLFEIGKQVKADIRAKVGEYISVSIGIGTNRFLAKTASNLKKPDGLEFIDHTNATSVYQKLSLIDLHGINKGFASRLAGIGIFNAYDFLLASPQALNSAFRSINSYQWYLRLRGWETDESDYSRKSFSNSYVLPKSTKDITEISAILMKLVFNTTQRLRAHKFRAKGIHLGILFGDKSYWHKGTILTSDLSDTSALYKVFFRLMYACPDIHTKPVKQISEACFYLTPASTLQLELFQNKPKQENITKAMDSINNTWGDFTLVPARMVHTKDHAKDTIAFGNVRA